MLEIGKAAPAFSLQDQNDKTLRRSDLEGGWSVLYFYPKDDTPGCTTQACEFTAAIAEFRGLEARVIGISPDSPESHRKFRAKYNLEVDLLSDPERKVLEKYEAWGEKNMYGKISVGVIRSTVILDPKGRVAHRWKKVVAKGHAEKVRQKLVELQGS